MACEIPAGEVLLDFFGMAEFTRAALDRISRCDFGMEAPTWHMHAAISSAMA